MPAMFHNLARCLRWTTVGCLLFSGCGGSPGGGKGPGDAAMSGRDFGGGPTDGPQQDRDGTVAGGDGSMGQPDGGVRNDMAGGGGDMAAGGADMAGGGSDGGHPGMDA